MQVKAPALLISIVLGAQGVLGGQGTLRGTAPGVPQPPFLRRDASSRVLYTKILEAEDKRVYSKALADMLVRSHMGVRSRAAMAIGRIGDPQGVQPLLDRLGFEESPAVRADIVFALGELEDTRALPFLFEMLKSKEASAMMRARAAEAIGKIGATERAAATLGGTNLAMLAAAVAEALPAPDRDPLGDDLLLGSLAITALLRLKQPESVGPLTAQLGSRSSSLRAQAANAIARLRPQAPPPATAAALAPMLKAADPIERANAARALGAIKASASGAEIAALLADADDRVRVSAVRALGALGDPKAAAPLAALAGRELDDYREHVEQRLPGVPPSHNILMALAEALGTLKDQSSLPVLQRMRALDGRAGSNPETELAVAAFGEAAFFDIPQSAAVPADWRHIASYAQGLGAVGGDRARRELADILAGRRFGALDPRAVSDVLTALGAAKPENLEQLVVEQLGAQDFVVRGTAAGIVAERFTGSQSEAVFRALEAALKASASDPEPDARLAILEAIAKFTRTRATDLLAGALGDPDYIVRRKAADLLQAAGAGTYRSKVPPATSPVRPRLYYEKVEIAMRRPHPTAVVATEKGDIRLELLTREAPMTVMNFIELAQKDYFKNVAFHRVVPNFVVQGGDPRGDGNGGPGYQIRCEINRIPYDRGAVGMALSGQDTGGSQFFVTHSPQPHLDGGYTVFARVTGGMDVVDRLARGDRILSVRIVEATLAEPAAGAERPVQGAAR